MEKEICVLVERDYDGQYERFALSVEEFKQEFLEHYPDMIKPSEEPEAYTITSLVYIWYQLSPVGDGLWNTFFSDMTWGLPIRDIKNRNFACIREDLMGKYRDRVITDFKENVL